MSGEKQESRPNKKARGYEAGPGRHESVARRAKDRLTQLVGARGTSPVVDLSSVPPSERPWPKRDVVLNSKDAEPPSKVIGRVVYGGIVAAPDRLADHGVESSFPAPSTRPYRGDVDFEAEDGFPDY